MSDWVIEVSGNEGYYVGDASVCGQLVVFGWLEMALPFKTERDAEKWKRLSEQRTARGLKVIRKSDIAPEKSQSSLQF